MVAGGTITVERGRGAIKKRMAQIKKRTVRRPATKVSMMGVADKGVGTIEQGRMQQPTIDGSGKGEQWLRE